MSPFPSPAGDTPATVIKEAHGAGLDIQCVDWEGQLGHLVATGKHGRVWSVGVWEKSVDQSVKPTPSVSLAGTP